MSVLPQVAPAVRRVLFLSANMGTGHTAAAANVLDALRRRNPAVEGQIVDAFQLAHSRVGRVMEDGYLQLLKILPQLYAFFYEPKEKPGAVGAVRRWLNQMGVASFAALIESYAPDLIVCTHAFPTGVCTLLKEQQRLSVPVVGVVTDYNVHPFWLSQAVDAYTVPTRELAAMLAGRGISSDRVHATGIPIDTRYGTLPDSAAARQRLGLDGDLPVVLVMGGGLGMEPVGRMLSTLPQLSQPMHLVILAGKNKRLQKKLRQRAQDGAARVQVHGYVENVHEFMAAADLLVTKPGGLTSSEALASSLPMLIVRPIPGQEQRNTRWLTSHKVAVQVHQDRDLSTAIQDALAAPALLRRMRVRARALGHPEAAFKVADVLEQVAGRRVLGLSAVC
ncbi:MAG: MGDG synthase family glycosyltransferase [Candidatus Xenobia bacterium]